MSAITIDENKGKYSSLYCARERKLSKLQHVLAWPSNNYPTNSIKNNFIGTNSFALTDIKIAENVFGPSVPMLKGKKVKQKKKLLWE